MKKYVCTKCNYEYETTELTGSFECPECGASSVDFEEKIGFKNRNAFNINQRILKVIDVKKKENGEIDELIVTVERCDEPKCYPNNPDVYYTGTPLEANALNEIIREMILEIKNKSVSEENMNNETEEE